MSNLEFKQLSHKIRFKERKFKFTQNQVDFLKTALDARNKINVFGWTCWYRKDLHGRIFGLADLDGRQPRKGYSVHQKHS